MSLEDEVFAPHMHEREPWAAVGIDESAVEHFSAAVGEGFAGAVAERKQPLSSDRQRPLRSSTPALH